MKEYRVPQKFWDDHVNRQCFDGDEATAVRKRGKNSVYVTLTDAQANELMSDADYYATSSDQEDFGLRNSARWTVKRLIQQGIAPIPQSNIRLY